MAWLSATPEGEKKSRGESLYEGGEGSPFLQLPDVEEAYYIVKHWQECGSVGAGSSGIMPLSWTEIKAWRTESELYLTYFELASIREMSKAYVNEYYAAKDKMRPAPYSTTEESFDRVAMSNKVSNVLQSFKKSVREESKYEIE